MVRTMWSSKPKTKEHPAILILSSFRLHPSSLLLNARMPAVDLDQLEQLVETLRKGDLDAREAARRIQDSLYEDIGYARVDHARAARQGFPEVVFGKGKPRSYVVGIVERLLKNSNSNLIVTHTDADTFGEIRNIVTGAE